MTKRRRFEFGMGNNPDAKSEWVLSFNFTPKPFKVEGEIGWWWVSVAIAGAILWYFL